MINKDQITVTSPLLPPLDEFIPYLEQIWDSKWITNNGQFHQQFEKALSEYLGVQYLSLFTNGTLPIITALQALKISGEVITTPYSFVATTHSIWWNGLNPVFVDIDATSGNIDPEKIEEAISPLTTAIMAVHVYGNPCDTKRIQEIADRHGLKVIYDAAHSFGVKVNGESILKSGDLSTLSFHATKVFTTFEGGALICSDPEMKKEIDYLKNFGFAGETKVVAPGINSKMDEMRAAFGLLNLKYVDKAIEARSNVAQQYREALMDIPGISFMNDILGVKRSYSYFPIFINSDKFGISRDDLYFRLKENGILVRRYFYPLISSFDPYKELPSAKPVNLPNATQFADSVICLPIHHELTNDNIDKVVRIISGAYQ